MPKVSRSVSVGFGAALAAFLVLLAPATNAAAAPDPAAVEAQIADVWNKLEPVIEQYNKVHGDLQANRAKSAALQKQIEPLQAQVDAALAQVSQIAVRQYITGPASTLNAMLSTGDPTALSDRLAVLDVMAGGQRQRISEVAVARDRFAGDKKALDDLIAKEAQQDAELAATKKTIETQLAELQKLRQQAYGAGGAATGSLKPVACPFEYIGGPAGTAITTACKQIGKPYVFAAGGPGSFDCSGLTQYAWKATGVSLAHYTKTQFSQTKRVSRADLRPGDLVFYFSDIHHVAIYAGGGWVVHAPQPGDSVRMAQMDRIGSINSFGRPA